MIESPSKYLSESTSDYEMLSLIDSCYAAFNEGVTDNFIVNVAASNTQAVLNEYLEHVRETLLGLYEKVLGYLNNYILNHAKLVERYKDLLIERFDQKQPQILFRTYQYHGLYDKNYPILMKSTGELTNNIRQLQSTIIEQENNVGVVNESVDAMIVDFGKSVINGVIDLNNIDESVADIVREHIRGQEIVRRLMRQDISKFITEVSQYKAMKDSIMATKKTMLEDYKILKNLLTREMNRAEASILGIEDIRKPDVAMLRNADYQRFASINLALARMFNSFIRIYSKAFDTKLNVLNDKITENKDILTKLMVETGVFAAINPHNPEKYKRPQKFDPKIKA